MFPSPLLFAAAARCSFRSSAYPCPQFLVSWMLGLGDKLGAALWGLVERWYPQMSGSCRGNIISLFHESSSSCCCCCCDCRWGRGQGCGLDSACRCWRSCLPNEGRPGIEALPGTAHDIDPGSSHAFPSISEDTFRQEFSRRMGAQGYALSFDIRREMQRDKQPLRM